jgi:integrase
LARFILLGLYTGSRSGVLLGLEWSWVDLNSGTMRRRAPGKAESKTKRTPRVRLGSRILAHLRRWRRLDDQKVKRVVHYEGRPVTKLRRSWVTARKAAKLDEAVTPHTLRHTRATWMMHDRVDLWQAAGALGMSVRMLERTYGHHHPDWQKDAAEV